MAYEQRLRLSKWAITFLLGFMLIVVWGGFSAPAQSAAHAVAIFSAVITCVGIILLWHPLHGTGRSVRIIGILAGGVLATRFLTQGADAMALAIFWGLVIAVIGSVNRSKIHVNSA